MARLIPSKSALALVVLATAGALAFDRGLITIDDISAWNLTVPDWDRARAYLSAAVEKSYHRSPMLAFGIAAALAVPFLSFVTYALRRVRQRRAYEAGAAARNGRRALVTSPLAKAWIEVEGSNREGLPLADELLRIGRSADNDLMLSDRNVHNFHALIRRTPEAEFMIIDISGSAGRGVTVNGQRLARVRLKDGDCIVLGSTRVRFHRALAVSPERRAVASAMAH